MCVDTLCCPHRCLIMWIWRGEKREKLYMLDECSTKQYVCICSLINQKLYALIDEKFGSPHQNEFTATKKPAMREVRISFFFEEWMLPLPNWNCENILGKLEWTYEKKKKQSLTKKSFFFKKKPETTKSRYFCCGHFISLSIVMALLKWNFVAFVQRPIQASATEWKQKK